MSLSKLDAFLENLGTSKRTRKSRQGLSRITQMLSRLGLQTQPKIPMITVGGTNGKGSTVAALQALSVHHGYRVGAFTSPHVSQFNERIAMDRTPALDTEILAAFEKISNVQEDLVLSYFDYSFLAARLIFEDSPLDLILWEVGIGGREDAVNVMDSNVAIVTSIDWDHQEILGNSLNLIAYQKAGIFRPHCPAIFPDHLPQILMDEALKIGAIPQILSDQEISEYGTVFSSLPLKIKPSNALLALKAFSSLFPTEHSKIQQAFSDIQQRGRQEWQDLLGHRKVLLDVAHNPESLNYLGEVLKAHLETHSYSSCWMIFSCQSSKWQNDLLSPFPFISHYLLAPLEDAESPAFQTIADQVFPRQSTEFKNLNQAFDYATTHLPPHGLLIICGSFHTVGAWIQYCSNVGIMSF